MDTFQTMPLQEFIAQTLVDIAEGVKVAQQRTAPKKVNEEGAGIGVCFTEVVQEWQGTHNRSGELLTEERNIISDLNYAVEFDIAVTIESSGGTETVRIRGVGGNISVISGEWSKDDKKADEAKNSSMSRLKFAVPIHFSGNEMMASYKTRYKGASIAASA